MIPSIYEGSRYLCSTLPGDKKAQPKYHLLLEELVFAAIVDVGVPTYGCEIPE